MIETNTPDMQSEGHVGEAVGSQGLDEASGQLVAPALRLERRKGGQSSNKNAEKYPINGTKTKLKGVGIGAFDARCRPIIERNAWLAAAIREKYGTSENMTALQKAELEQLANDRLILDKAFVEVMSGNRKRADFFTYLGIWDSLRKSFAERLKRAGIRQVSATPAPELEDDFNEAAS